MIDELIETLTWMLKALEASRELGGLSVEFVKATKLLKRLKQRKRENEQRDRNLEDGRSYMLRKYPRATKDRRTGFWVVRLAEIIAKGTQEEAELEAKVKLECYHKVSSHLYSVCFPIHDDRGWIAAEYWEDKYNELKKEIT